jgi:hypothetical protein
VVSALQNVERPDHLFGDRADLDMGQETLALAP